jgi:hypothetical protein
MDPQSAFTLAGIPTWHGDRTRLLMASANVGFCPALRQTFAALAENPRLIGKARELLSVAAFRYGDPLSLYEMGCLLAEDPPPRRRRSLPSCVRRMPDLRGRNPVWALGK